MPSDKEMLDLCYSMLKQLDQKGIDWDIVALENGITNAAAARKRFSRFKLQVDPTDQASPTPSPTKAKRKAVGGDINTTPSKRKGSKKTDAKSIKGEEGQETTADEIIKEEASDT